MGDTFAGNPPPACPQVQQTGGLKLDHGQDLIRDLSSLSPSVHPACFLLAPSLYPLHSCPLPSLSPIIVVSGRVTHRGNFCPNLAGFLGGRPNFLELLHTGGIIVHTGSKICQLHNWAIDPRVVQKGRMMDDEIVQDPRWLIANLPLQTPTENKSKGDT